MPSLPSASTSCEGVAPGTSTSVALTPPRSTSPWSSGNQLGGAQKSLKAGPACKRIMASPPIQLPWVLKVFPVITNMLVPSLATPECPQMPPPTAAVAQTLTLEGVLIVIPTTQPWYVPQSPASPEN